MAHSEAGKQPGHIFSPSTSLTLKPFILAYNPIYSALKNRTSFYCHTFAYLTHCGQQRAPVSYRYIATNTNR